MADIIVAFDFDMTLIDCNSDTWIVDELGATDIFDTLLPTMQWNSLMDRMMEELHLQGRTIEEIARCLMKVPIDPHVAAAVKSAHGLGCDLRVVSDANVFFIETILEHHGLISYFSEISTNPSRVEEDGRLRVLPYHHSSSSHGCNLCPPNMCKGNIIERFRAADEKMKRFIYVGDGKGDYCPSLKLRQGDCVMPRRDYPLWNLIRSSSDMVKAEVHDWSDGEEMERLLLQLVSN